MHLQLVPAATSMGLSPVLPETSAGLSYMCGFLQLSVVTTLVLVMKIDVVCFHHIISMGVFVQLDQVSS